MSFTDFFWSRTTRGFHQLSAMPDLAGCCWWFCWKHLFFGDDEHIVADICRYLQMNLESRQKKTTKKKHNMHRTFINF
jgi:hypothetical protein